MKTLTLLILACLLNSQPIVAQDLIAVPIPSSGTPNHDLFSYHQYQYLSCDFVSSSSTDNLASSAMDQDPTHLAIASQTWVYALMASNAYRDTGYVYTIPDWKVIARWESPSSLALEEWHHQDATGKVDEIVIAFEGTGSAADWRANLSLIEPRQNKEAYEFIKSVVARANGARITTTGHSLGGALALNMSLRYDNVAFRGFDASPRGFYKITRSKYPAASRIFIYEKGEALSFVRTLWFNRFRKFNDIYWYNFMKFRFQKGVAAIENHDMYLIARGLLLAAIKNGDAKAGQAFTSNLQTKDLQEIFKVVPGEESIAESIHDKQCCEWIFTTYPAKKP